MKIRNNMRITALVLALVMLLPLISIPTFAEETPINYVEDFESNNLNVLQSWPAHTSVADGVLRMEGTAINDSNFYGMKNQNNATVITGATVENGTLTGKITLSSVVYNITGPVTYTKTKPAAATLTKEADGSAYSGDPIYIFSGAACDAWKGNGHVAKELYIKNPAVDAAKTSKVTVSADYFFSADFTNGVGCEVTIDTNGNGAASSNPRIDLALLKSQNGYIEIQGHGNEDETKGGGVTLRAPKGTWFNLRADIDLATGEIEVYVNGEYSKTIVDSAATTGIKGNCFNVVKISRGTTPNDPATMKGYALVDNVVFTSENKVYYSNDFDQYAGMSRADIEGGTYQDNFGSQGVLPSKLEVVTENDNTYIKYNFGADYKGTKYDTQYFGWANYTEWSNNKNIVSYDRASNTLTLKDGTTYTVTPGTDAQLAAGYYGTIDGQKNSDGVQFVLTTGPYAAENKFGDGNVDKAVSLLVPPMTSTEYSEIYLSAKFFIEENSKGMSEMQFRYFNATGYPSMGSINLSSGVHNTSGLILPIGEWVTFGVKIDMVSGKTTYYVFAADGTVQSKQAGDIGDNITAYWNGAAYRSPELIISKHNKSSGAGSISIDDVQISATSLIPTDGKNVIKLENFNTYSDGNAPSGSFQSFGHKETAVDSTKGYKSWKINYNNVGGTGNTDSGDLNIDPYTTLKHDALSYQTSPIVVFEADYYITVGSKGRIQSQANGLSSNGAAAINWSDLYQLQGDSGNWVLAREGGTKDGSAAIPLNRWNTVSAELNLVTGKLNVYLNNVLAVDSWLKMDDAASRTNITIAANNWVVGKVNKHLGSGTFYMDNLKIYAGTVDATVYDFENFEAFKSNDGISAVGSILAAPALTTFKVVDGNTVLRLGMGAAKSETEYCLYNASTKEAPKYGVAYTAGAEKITYNGTEYTIAYDEAKSNLPYITIGEAKYYIISSALGETAYGGANVGASLQIFANTLSYKDSKTAILEEDLFIEEGSTGILESQFTGFAYEGSESSGGWLQLFHLHMATGLLAGQGGTDYGVYLNKGEWNNIKILVNLETGVFEVYANGVLARTYDCGKDNITLNSAWIPVKVQRHNLGSAEVYEGGILVDNVRVSAVDVPTADSNYGASFLTDAAFEAYVADLLTSVNGASIRLANPSGLRFASKVNETKLNYLTKMLGDEIVTDCGTLITPAAYVQAAGDFSKEALDKLDVSTAYVDVKFDGVYFSGDAGFSVGDDKYVVGSIVNILEKNITRQFAGAAYVELTIGDQVVTIYADEQIRSVREVADLALADENASWDANALEVLNKYATPKQ